MSSLFGLWSSYMLEYCWLFALLLRSARYFPGAEGEWILLPPMLPPSSPFSILCGRWEWFCRNCLTNCLQSLPLPHSLYSLDISAVLSASHPKNYTLFELLKYLPSILPLDMALKSLSMTFCSWRYWRVTLWLSLVEVGPALSYGAQSGPFPFTLHFGMCLWWPNIKAETTQS